MCETRDPGIKCPFWHTLMFGNDIKIDTRFVCPKDVKKMLVHTARSVYWKKWAAKHEYEELKEGAWMEPLLRKKVRENWTEKHHNVARKIFLEGGWTQQRLFDIDWPDTSQCQAWKKDEGTEMHRLYHCSEWHEVRREIPEVLGSWSKQQEPRRSGSGKEVLLNILSVEVNGTGAISA